MPFVSVCCFSIPLHKQWKMSVSSVTELSCVDENVNSQPFIIVFLGKMHARTQTNLDCCTFLVTNRHVCINQILAL